MVHTASMLLVEVVHVIVKCSPYTNIYSGFQPHYTRNVEGKNTQHVFSLLAKT